MVVVRMIGCGNKTYSWSASYRGICPDEVAQYGSLLEDSFKREIAMDADLRLSRKEHERFERRGCLIVCDPSKVRIPSRECLDVYLVPRTRARLVGGASVDEVFVSSAQHLPERFAHQAGYTSKEEMLADIVGDRRDEILSCYLFRDFARI